MYLKRFIINVVVGSMALLSPSWGVEPDAGLSVTIGYHGTTNDYERRELDLRTPESDVDVVITNHTAQPVRLWESWNSWGCFSVFFEVFDDHDRFLYRIEKDRDRVSFTRNIPRTFVLYPGDSYVYEAEWDGWWKLPFYEGAGRYELRMRAVYRSERETDERRMRWWSESVPGGWDPQKGLWTGTVRSEILPYSISYHKPRPEKIK